MGAIEIRLAAAPWAVRAMALLVSFAGAPFARAALPDDVFCNGFDTTSACPATPFMVVPNRAWTSANTPFSTYLSTSATVTSVVLNGSGGPIPAAITGQSGNRVDAVVPAYSLSPGLWSAQVTTLGTAAQTSSLLLITGTPGSLALAYASPSGVSNQELGRVTLFATDPPPPGTEGFSAMPEVFLQLHGSFNNVTRIDDRDFISPGQLAIAIPAGLAAGYYDVIAINPDGATGVITYALGISANAAPVITRRTPEVSVAASGQQITLYGANFGAGTPTVFATCVDASGGIVVSPPGTMGAHTDSSATVVFDFSSLPVGSQCRLSLTASDGQVASIANQAISNASLNLGPTASTGQTLLQGRRGGVLLAGPVTAQGHRLYIVGGDNGTAVGAMASVESAEIGAFGALGAFRVETYSLPQALTFAAGVTAGDYLYILGGNNGAGSMRTAYRSRVLRDLRDPTFATLGALPAAQAGTGIGPGLWRYSVAPLISATDSDNPSGEGLPGAELSVDVPAAQNGVQILLTFSSTLPNVTDFAVYRSPTAGASTLERLAVVPITGGLTTYTDTGGATNSAISPLPAGSLANWYTLPLMASNREAVAIAVASDPVTADAGYVYAIAGRSGPGTVLTSYEYLPFTTATDGRQTISSWTSGISALGAGRANLGAWTADTYSTPVISAGNTYIYPGPGVASSGVGAVDAGKVAVGGDLGTWDATPTDVPTLNYGYSTARVDDRLYLIGGASGAPSSGVKQAHIVAPAPTLGVGAWNNEGASLTRGVIYAGAASTDGFIYIAGGQTTAPSAADNFVQRIQQ